VTILKTDSDWKLFANNAKQMSIFPTSGCVLAMGKPFILIKVAAMLFNSKQTILNLSR
jgi:hypothetical protein